MNSERAKSEFKVPEHEEPAAEQLRQVQEKAAFEAAKVFEKPKLRDFVEKARKAHEQIIDTVNLDKVTFSGFDGQAKDQGAVMIKAFKSFVEENRNTITELSIFYDQPWLRHGIIFRMI
jgi:type I restriction enzyme, R subunit